MIARAISLALLYLVWQGVAVAVLLSVVLAIARSPQVRYAASCFALAALAIAPVVTALVVYRPPMAISIPLGFLPPPVSLVEVLRAWTLPVWSLGVLLFSIRLVWGWGQVSILRRAAKPAEDNIVAMVAGVAGTMGVTRRIQVLISSLAESPSVVGWLRPVILLPAATVLGLTPEQLEAVIAHEIAHIRRYDYLVNALQMLVETALFYHPAVWWISSRIRHERELCCDDAAVAYCGDAVSYARALTTLERVRATTLSLAVSSTGGSLRHRVERLLGASAEKVAPSRWPAVLAISLALLAFALNVNWANGQAPSPAPLPPPAAPQTTSPQPSAPASVAPKPVSPAATANPATEQADDHAAERAATRQFLEEQLREAQEQYAEGQERFTDKYPAMVVLQDRIANLQIRVAAIQRGEGPAQAQNDAALRALKQELESQRFLTQARQAELAGVQAQMQSLQAQLAAAQERMKVLQEQYERLERSTGQIPAPQDQQRAVQARDLRQEMDRLMQQLIDRAKRDYEQNQQK